MLTGHGECEIGLRVGCLSYVCRPDTLIVQTVAPVTSTTHMRHSPVSQNSPSKSLSASPAAITASCRASFSLENSVPSRSMISRPS